MVGFAQLRDARLGELDSAWRVWRRLVIKLEEAEDAYRNNLLQPVRNSRWRGKAAQAAFGELVPVEQKFRIAATEASAIASVIHSAHRDFRTAQEKLSAAIARAEGLYLRVGHDGSLSFPNALPPGYTDWVHLKNDAQRIQQEFVIAVKEASTADQKIAEALKELDPKLDDPNATVDAAQDAKLATQLAGFDAGRIPPRGVDSPQEVAKWWKSLPEEQRHLMINAYPEKMGWLDGVPSEDRDEANRARLADRLAELEKAKQHHIPNRWEARDYRRLKWIQDYLSKAEAAGEEKYLLGLDPTSSNASPPGSDNQAPLGQYHQNDGKVIIANGNPDTARNVAVFVPGMGTELDNIGDELQRAENLQNAALRYSDSVSTITWLGYDAPDDVGAALERNYGMEAGPTLDRFTEGLRATAEGGGRQHITAIGHSYGSTVIGEAAKNDQYGSVKGLGADDIIVAGSPGMHVGHARDLNIDPRHVWSQQASLDPVPAGGSLTHGDWTWTGAVTPTDEEFGANRMTTQTTGHSSYWENETIDLNNQAKVVTSKYHNVGLLRGSAPQ